MIIPLRDVNRSHGFPKVTLSIVALNVAVFAAEAVIGTVLIQMFACKPVRIIELLNLRFTRIIYLPGLLTYMFLHANLWHLAGNMLFLWIFGDNVEDRMGGRRFFNFYLLCGLLAGLTHVFMHSGSGVPMVGASGAIAGVLGAYFVLFPKAKVHAWVAVWVFQLPAWIFLGAWLGTQVLFSIYSPSEGVAWYAHIGGFVAGMVLVKWFVKGRLK